ncbi:hypothetical protein DFP72DRAFT_1046962 [Ephemerocybe angulata]|uniref:F-box domain-containing protein n=1 Tax=Ephemerocybe angulata TaxID=980116 RepID=A0A8H6M4G8_9AGAR|nr:hypothetical protein DFP72DRAFT_1046962 [Tulosesus angulatus]
MPPRASKKPRRSAPTITADSAPKVRLGAGTSIDLPTELYFEILSYFPVVPFETTVHHSYDSGFHLNVKTLERQDALRTMSQVSRSWRAFFLPMLWENVEMAGCRSGPGTGGWFKQCADALIQKGNGLSETPELAKYVKRIRLVMSQSSIHKTLPALRALMTSCSGLKTVHIHFAHSDTAKQFSAEFKPGQDSFPSVETLILPIQAHALLRACPNAKRLTCNRGRGSQLITAMKAGCKHLEMVEGFYFYQEDNLFKKLVKAAPNLREIKLNCLPSEDVLKKLQTSFKELKAIEFPGVYLAANGEAMERTIALLKRTLRNCTVTFKANAYAVEKGTATTKVVHIGA